MIATTLDVPNRAGLYDTGRWLVALVADSADAVRFDARHPLRVITRGSTPERRRDKPVETICGKGVAVQSVDNGAALWVKLLGAEGQRIADEITHEGYEWSLGLETLGGVARTGVASYRSLGDESWPRALIADKPPTQLAEMWRLAGDPELVWLGGEQAASAPARCPTCGR